MAVQEAMPLRPVGSGFSVLNDERVRGVIFQVLLIVAIAAFASWIIHNTAANLRAQGIGFGFGILEDTAGFQINQALIPYQETSTYGRVYLVGLLNTLLVAVLGIVLATIIGFIVGISRLSKNWIVAKAATAYVEALRNIPLLLQIFIWYFAVLRLLPQKRDALSLGPLGLINIAGWYAPNPIFGEDFWFVSIAALIAIAATIAVSRWAHQRQLATGEQFPVFWAGMGLIVGVDACDLA